LSFSSAIFWAAAIGAMFSYASGTRICIAPSTQDGSSTLFFFPEQSFVTEQDTKRKWHEDGEASEVSPLL